MSDHRDPADDAEDIPSDFFDDFNKEEFMEGLSVIDSWDDEAGKPRSRLNAEALDSVHDLRELIGDAREDDRSNRNRRSSREARDRQSDRYGRSNSRKLDDYIKPGSRRDPSKTKEAIKRDKEVKVKEYLAKKIEGSDDLRPPGTELDDYMDETKLMEKKQPTVERSVRRRSQGRQRRDRESQERPRRDRESPRPHRESPRPHRESPRPHRETPRPHRESPRPHRESPRLRREDRESPRQRREDRESPRQRRDSPSRNRRRRSPRRSPLREQHRSPRWSPRPGFDHNYPRRNFQRGRGQEVSPLRHRPNAYGHSRSPRRHSPLYECRSRSPRRDFYRRSRSRSPQRDHDSFLYPHNDIPGSSYPPVGYPPQPELFPGPGMEYPGGGPPGYPYQQSPFSGGFPTRPFDYAPQLTPPEMMPPLMPVPQPVPAPMMVPPVPGPTASVTSITIPSSTLMPSAVPAPNVSPVSVNLLKKETKTPFDALAQLVAEGKLSKEDYLKLAPNKSKSARLLDVSTTVETNAKVDVLNRCNAALSKLGRVHMANHLVIKTDMLGPEPKAIQPKFCSPLKRQATTEFFFTTPSAHAASTHNKQLIDAVIAAVGLTNVVARPKKHTPKNMKDAAVQTTKPYCDVCEVREATRSYDTSTSIDPEHFSTSTHTQVLEQDLLNSKAMFTPSGSIGDGGAMSIAHLTPAQLVSQLAARAKTLKQTEPAPSQPQTQFGRRPGYDYDYDRDYDNRGQQYHNSYNNYNRY